MTYVRETIINEDHPSLPGHFPGNPIVPGVVLLDQVRISVSLWRQGNIITALPQVKFHLPLFPEQAFTIHLQEQNGKFSFRCNRGDDLLAQGSMRLGQPT